MHAGHQLHVDEGAQALVLAEVAAGVFAAVRDVADFLHGFEADKGGLAAHAPEAVGFDGGSDGSGFAAVLVDDDVGLDAFVAEARFDEIDLGLDGGEVVLRAALEDESVAERGQVRNLRDVQPDIFRQDVGEAGENFFRLPALALEIDDVGLHEDGAAVAEHGHGLGAEGQVGELGDVEAEAHGRRLQEVAVARRALGVELEVFHAAVLQNDELDVLAAYVADHVGLRIKVQRGFGVRDGFDDGGIGARTSRRMSLA